MLCMGTHHALNTGNVAISCKLHYNNEATQNDKQYKHQLESFSPLCGYENLNQQQKVGFVANYST